jgi:hypothetical protein
LNILQLHYRTAKTANAGTLSEVHIIQEKGYAIDRRKIHLKGVEDFLSSFAYRHLPKVTVWVLAGSTSHVSKFIFYKEMIAALLPAYLPGQFVDQLHIPVE